MLQHPDALPLRVTLEGPGGGSQAGPVTLTDHSITNATGASQALVAANAARRSLSIINEAATPWTIHPIGGPAAAGTPPCFTLHPGEAWEPMPPPAGAVTGIGTAASKLIVLEG